MGYPAAVCVFLITQKSEDINFFFQFLELQLGMQFLHTVIMFIHWKMNIFYPLEDEKLVFKTMK